MTWDPVWEKIFSSQSWGRYPGEPLIRFVASHFYAQGSRDAVKFLEVGCGPGSNLWFLAREGFSFVGIDGSSSAIRHARERLDNECKGWRQRGELHVCDMTSLPFSNESFDAAIDVEAISTNSWDDSKRIYKELARVTKAGGKAFSQTFAVSSWGARSGEPAGRNAWRSDVGPFADKGVTRFTAFEDIPELIKDFELETLEIVKRSVNELRSEIHEWVIVGKRP